MTINHHANDLSILYKIFLLQIMSAICRQLQKIVFLEVSIETDPPIVAHKDVRDQENL